MLNLYYKFNGKINIYECLKCIPKYTYGFLYVKYVQNNYYLFDAITHCEICNLNYRYINLHTLIEKKNYTDDRFKLLNKLYCLYAYFKHYENKIIDKIDINLINEIFFTDILCWNIERKKYYGNSKIKNIVIFFIALLYCIKNKNSDILCQIVNYLTENNSEFDCFEIIYLLSSSTEIYKIYPLLHGYSDYYEDLFNGFNKKIYKILLTKEYFDIIKNIICNIKFYNNITNVDYKYIYEITNIENPNKIDYIILKNIHNTNILNTTEYLNAIDEYNK